MIQRTLINFDFDFELEFDIDIDIDIDNCINICIDTNINIDIHNSNTDASTLNPVHACWWRFWLIFNEFNNQKFLLILFKPLDFWSAHNLLAAPPVLELHYLFKGLLQSIDWLLLLKPAWRITDPPSQSERCQREARERPERGAPRGSGGMARKRKKKIHSSCFAAANVGENYIFNFHHQQKTLKKRIWFFFYGYTENHVFNIGYIIFLWVFFNAWTTMIV